MYKTTSEQIKYYRWVYLSKVLTLFVGCLEKNEKYFPDDEFFSSLLRINKFMLNAMEKIMDELPTDWKSPILDAISTNEVMRDND